MVRPAGLSMGRGLHCAEADLPPDIPGILVRRGDRVLGVVGFGREPDGSVSATPPVLTPSAGWMDHQAIVTLLFQAVQNEARRLGAYGVHCLLPVSSDASPSQQLAPEQLPSDQATQPASGETGFSTAELMQKTGLKSVASVVRLSKDLRPLMHQRKSSPSTLPEAAGEGLEAGAVAFTAQTRAATDPLSGELESVLDEILRHSDDLPADIRPTGARLLKTWCGRGDLLVLVRDPSGVAGIAALSGLATSSAVLEYIGVVPAYRRRGIGRRLLRLVEQQIMSRPGNEGDGPLVLTAYADAANEPAVSLYRAAGYSRTERYQLYYCHLPVAGNSATRSV